MALAEKNTESEASARPGACRPLWPRVESPAANERDDVYEASPMKRPRAWFPVLAPAAIWATALAGVFIQAWHYNWKLDDAYISFVYARNLVEGHGLVFNVGERVEGYTCFLWVLLCALGLALGVSAETWSTALGLLAALGTLAACAALARTIAPRASALVGPLTALLLALWPPFAWWAVSGMETVLFTALVTTAFYLYIRSGPQSLAAPVVTALAALTRPEGWLLGAILCAHAVTQRSQRGWRFLLLFAALFVPWFAWRVWYYGYLLPNTFYAKVGDSWEQLIRGFAYLRQFVLDWGGVLFAAAVVGALFLPWRRLLPLYVFLLLYSGYVVAVGGDVFHFYRFWIPVVPTLLSLGCAALAYLLVAPRPRATRYLVVLLSVPLVLRLLWVVAIDIPKILKHRDAEQFLTVMGQYTCRCLLAKTEAHESVAALGVGLTRYCTNRTVIDMLGLTDLHIARHARVPMGAGLAGHEKYDSVYVLSRQPRYILIPPQDFKGIILPAVRDMWQQPEFRAKYRRDECGFRRID